MSASQLTRRQVMGGVLGMVGVTRLAAVSAAPTAGRSGAAAAGTLTIGGDLVVNRMGFGAMRVTGPGIWGEPKDPAEARRVLRRAVELGVNFIDTADSYGPEVSERLIAETLAPYPRGLVIATKGGLLRPSAPQWVPDGRPAHLRVACEGSLKRLKLARARRVVPVVSVQNRYNLADRGSEDVLGVCARDGLAFIPWAPLASGSASRLEVSDALEKVAAAHGVSVMQVAIAWLLAKSPAMLPIPGTGSVAHLEEDLAAARLQLTPEELARLG